MNQDGGIPIDFGKFAGEINPVEINVLGTFDVAFIEFLRSPDIHHDQLGFRIDQVDRLLSGEMLHRGFALIPESDVRAGTKEEGKESYFDRSVQIHG